MSMNFPTIEIPLKASIMSEMAPAVAGIPPDPQTRADAPMGSGTGFALSTRQWLLILLCCVINTAVGITLYHAWHKHDSFAVVNLGQVYRDKEQEFTKMLASPGMTDNDRAVAIKSAQDFAVALPKAMQALSDECHCIVLMGNAVAGTPSGVTDLTPVLRKRVGL